MSKRIEDYIQDFMKERSIAQEPRFYLETLNQYVYVKSNKIAAPGSIGRILRKMKKEGKVNYESINHLHSLYLALPLTLEQ